MASRTSSFRLKLASMQSCETFSVISDALILVCVAITYRLYILVKKLRWKFGGKVYRFDIDTDLAQQPAQRNHVDKYRTVKLFCGEFFERDAVAYRAAEFTLFAFRITGRRLDKYVFGTNRRVGCL